MHDGRKRIVIENVHPELDYGRYPVKRVTGENVVVRADVFSDGHDEISVFLCFRGGDHGKWREVPMRPLGNDVWEGVFTITEESTYHYSVLGVVDFFATWKKDLEKKHAAGQNVRADFVIGADYIDGAAGQAQRADADRLKGFSRILRTCEAVSVGMETALNLELSEIMASYPDRSAATMYPKELRVWVDRKKAVFSAWYELFPRSASPDPKRAGTLKDCERLLPDIAKLGFDVLYLPPIHPIGTANRKGKNNAPKCGPGDVGSPWAIGSETGGHKSIDPFLGTMSDFKRLVQEAAKHGIEVALDLAYQCSPDHPYVKAHPEWFRKRPDGTIQYAENPPKKYEDIVPFNFETRDWKALWDELKSIVLFWIEAGVRIFRVDNPHTKPFLFWEWLFAEMRRDHPDVIFLSEAFTRPKIMNCLAKTGFTQSYTYFTWRSTKAEIAEYMTELTHGACREYFRPNFWPNTPDILMEYLQRGARPMFAVRVILAATLSSNYGIFGPSYELCVTEALPGKEEYLDSEKYEVRHWDRNGAGNIRKIIEKLNRIRRANASLQATNNFRLCETDNDYIFAYLKTTPDVSNVILAVVNMDPLYTQSGWVKLPISELGIEPYGAFMVHDLLNDNKYVWQGEKNYVELNPSITAAHVFLVSKTLK
ncbi:MAG: alpha-1,4-glucan--maltose-1-phosphate maltosyltransferase [Candidatus Omnitrophota bacterium]